MTTQPHTIPQRYNHASLECIIQTRVQTIRGGALGQNKLIIINWSHGKVWQPANNIHSLDNSIHEVVTLILKSILY